MILTNKLFLNNRELQGSASQIALLSL